MEEQPMNTSTVNHQPFRGLLVLLALTLALIGCDNTSPGAFSAELSVSEPEVKLGGSTTISAKLKHYPNGLRCFWSAELGQCEPAEVENLASENLETIYTAPSSLSDDKDLTIEITIKFVQDGRPICEDKKVSVTIKKGNIPKERGEPGVTIPGPSSPPALGSDAQPKIEITKIPPYSFGGPVELFRIAGKVTGVPPEGYHIALYALTDYWYIQPFNTGDLRFTDIEVDGSFSTQTHGGVKYAALLVRDSFTDPPIKTDRLPRKGKDKDVVADHIVEGSK
jgi:hypothetical protein